MTDQKVRYTERSYMQLILQKDPQFHAENRDVPFYDFSHHPGGRIFRGDPRKVATAYPDP